ncbi:MAG: hypothetical protein OXG38_06885 [Chloroflexi bacterium]|nr:hypothetical protein [Chloroflexota bacterium]
MPIARQAKVGPSILDRLMRRQPRRNAIAEIRDLLIDAERVEDVEPEAVQAIADRYGVRLHNDFTPERDTIYKEYLNDCLADRRLDDSELQALRHLQQLLDITDPAAERLRGSAVEPIWRRAVSEAVEDGRLTDEESIALGRLHDELSLGAEQGKRIYAEVANQRMRIAYDRALADERLSPEEDAELREIARSLNVTVTTDETSRRALDRFRRYWLIENGDVPLIEPGIKLYRGEKCYAKRQVEWRELRRVTTGISYAGPTARIRLAKGVYWRMGHLRGMRHSSEMLTRVDAGTLYLTTKRLIFMGPLGNKTIRLNRILTFEPYSNGIEIQKDAGRNPVLLFGDDVEMFAALLQRAWSDAG